MKETTILIGGCKRCPYSTNYCFSCRLKNKRIDKRPHPDWCPLEDA